MKQNIDPSRFEIKGNMDIGSRYRPGKLMQLKYVGFPTGFKGWLGNFRMLLLLFIASISSMNGLPILTTKETDSCGVMEFRC